MEEFVDVAIASGAAALNVIPDRNYTPGAPDDKVKNLYEVVALAERRGFPVVAGTEMNAPGQKFVDSFSSAELKPLAPIFLRSAYIVYAHSVLQRAGWARLPQRVGESEFRLGRGEERLLCRGGARLAARRRREARRARRRRLRRSNCLQDWNERPAMNDIPQTERAVQLVGPDKLELNSAKPVADPGPHQVLARVEAVGLCFSDLKLLKQFSQHSRKSDVLTGLDAQALAEMPNYVPGDAPTVPGHEAVIRVVKVGPGVDRYKTGERFIVETDYRWLPTDKSNAAFGYNFEGGLQEYVLLDERVITSPEGESMLIPAPEDLSASALALVEPWACVENAYTEVQRRTLKPGGRLLVVGDAPVDRAVGRQVPRAAGLRRLRDRRFRRRAAGRELRRHRLFRRRRRDGGEAVRQARRRRAAGDRPGRPQVRPTGRDAGRPRPLRRHPRRRNRRRRSGGGLCRDSGQPRDPPGRQDQHRRRGGADGHDARHPRPVSGRRGRDRLRRRSQRRASRRARRARFAAGREERRHAAPLQSVEESARASPSTTSC